MSAKKSKKTTPHAVKRRVLGKERAAEAKKAAPKKPLSRGDFAKRLAEFERRRARPVGLLEAFAKVATFLGATFVRALFTPDEAVRAAGGDLIEAMGGHACGPECWHAPEGSVAEKQAWWDKRIADFDAKVAARASRRPAGWKPCAACLDSGPDAVSTCSHGKMEMRCEAYNGMTRCVRTCIDGVPHAGAHQDDKWATGAHGAVSWWS